MNTPNQFQTSASTRTMPLPTATGRQVRDAEAERGPDGSYVPQGDVGPDPPTATEVTWRPPVNKRSMSWRVMSGSDPQAGLQVARSLVALVAEHVMSGLQGSAP